jgi:nitrogen fixation/metabolism regulation signal transduction histidine kinase
MATRIENLRSKYLINKKFQLGLIIYFLCFYFIALLALYLLVRFSVNASVESLKDYDPLNFSTLDLFMEHITEVLNYAFLLFAFAGGLFAFLGGILISSKVAGPLSRLQKIIQNMATGQLKNDFKVRKNDSYSELFEDLEKLEHSLRK